MLLHRGKTVGEKARFINVTRVTFNYSQSYWKPARYILLPADS